VVAKSLLIGNVVARRSKSSAFALRNNMNGRCCSFVLSRLLRACRGRKISKQELHMSADSMTRVPIYEHLFLPITGGFLTTTLSSYDHEVPAQRFLVELTTSHRVPLHSLRTCRHLKSIQNPLEPLSGILSLQVPTSMSRCS
jgi:hypothetical protein